MLKIHFFPVGRGDSILIEFPDNRIGIIDSNMFADYCFPMKAVLKKYLNDEKGNRSIEFIHLTHPHLDHFKGMEEILESIEFSKDTIFYTTIQLYKRESKQFKVLSDIGEEDNVKCKECNLINEDEDIFDKKYFSSMIDKLLKEENYEYIKLAGGERIVRKKRADLEYHFLCPTDGYRNEFSNQRRKRRTMLYGMYRPKMHLISSIMLLRYGKTKILLCGDALECAFVHAKDEYEKLDLAGKFDELVPTLKSDLVKLPHHGSKYNNNDYVLRAICKDNITKAVITNTDERMKGQVYKETAKRLNEKNVEYKTTGDVRINYNGFNYYEGIKQGEVVNFIRVTGNENVEFEWLTAAIDQEKNICFEKNTALCVQ